MTPAHILTRIKNALHKKPKAPTNIIRYLGEAFDLDNLQPGETGVIAGDLVIMSVNTPLKNNEYIAQPPRTSRRQDLSIAALQQKPNAIHFAIRPAALHKLRDIRNNQSHIRLLCAADAVLNYGKKHKTGTIVVVNGYTNHHQTAFDTYVFRNGQLIEIDEASLNPPEHIRYAVDVKQRLDALRNRHPTATIHWTPPLPTPYIEGHAIQTVDESIYLNQTYPPLHDPEQPANNYRASAAIALCATIGSTALIANDVYDFDNARDQFRSLTREKPDQAPSIALPVQQTRADWVRNIKTATSRLPTVTKLLNAVAENADWHITALAVDTSAPDTAQKAGAQSPDNAPITITLNIPYDAKIPAITQAQPVVIALKDKTGLKLNVAQQGIHPDLKNNALQINIGVEN